MYLPISPPLLCAPVYQIVISYYFRGSIPPSKAGSFLPAHKEWLLVLLATLCKADISTYLLYPSGSILDHTEAQIPPSYARVDKRRDKEDQEAKLGDGPEIRAACVHPFIKVKFSIISGGQPPNPRLSASWPGSGVDQKQ